MLVVELLFLLRCLVARLHLHVSTLALLLSHAVIQLLTAAILETAPRAQFLFPRNVWVDTWSFVAYLVDQRISDVINSVERLDSVASMHVLEPAIHLRVMLLLNRAQVRRHLVGRRVGPRGEIVGTLVQPFVTLPLHALM